MKRGSKKQQLDSEGTSSGPSAVSAERNEDLTEGDHESPDDATGQKQTEAENKRVPSYRFESHDEPEDLCFLECSTPSSANIYRPEPLKTPSLLNETTCLLSEAPPPASSLQPPGSMNMEHLSAPLSFDPYEFILDQPGPHEGFPSRPTRIREDPPAGVSTTNPEYQDLYSMDLWDSSPMLSPPAASSEGPELSRDLSLPSTRQLKPQMSPLLHHPSPQIPPWRITVAHPPKDAIYRGLEVPAGASQSGLSSGFILPQGPTPSSSTDPFHNSWDPSHTFSPPVPRWGQQTEQADKETETMVRINKRAEPASVSQPYKYFPRLNPMLASTRLSHFPQSLHDVSSPEQSSSSVLPTISEAKTKRISSQGSLYIQKHSISPPPSSSLPILPSVTGRFCDYIRKRLKGLEGATGAQREGKPASDQELRGQEKRDEEANPPAGSRSRRRSSLLHHPSPQIPAWHIPPLKDAIYGGLKVPAAPIHLGIISGVSLTQHQGPTPSSSMDPSLYSWDPSFMSSPPVPQYGPETEQVDKETETMVGVNKRAEPGSVSQPYEYGQLKLKRKTKRIRSQGSFHRQKHSISPPPSSSLPILPSVTGPQFPERSNKRLKGLERTTGAQREGKPTSDQELRGQEKREEEANPPARLGRTLPHAFIDHREQKGSPPIQHHSPRFPAPTPECINTETHEEAGAGSGSLSVSEGTEPVLHEDPGPDQDLLEAAPPVMAELSSDVQFCSTDSGWTRRTSSSLPGSVSMPSLSHMTSAGSNKPTRAASLPDMKLQSSFEEFTPDFSEDHEEHESYRFQCSCPGLYQCSVTGLVFDMEGEGDVVYRTVPWNWRLLVQHHKKPAGPLFDIKCEQQCVRQLHLPHCQIRPTAGFLAVAHVNDDGVEFISPHKITETHIVINVTGFSGFGNVKDEDSPPEPVRALVLLFYRPPEDPDVTSVLNVLLLPRNIVIRDVQRTRRKLVGEERYMETSPHCKLHPGQVYTLSTAPEDDSVLVQPTEAEFDAESYDNYFPAFQVILETRMKHMKLFLRDSSSHSVWERRVCLSSAGQIKSCGSNPPNKKLLDVQSRFIDGTSGPVLNSLLDKLLEKKVLTDSERESADEMQNRRDKARFVIDTVRKKGDAASSEMIEFLCEADPFLCKHLGLT